MTRLPALGRIGRLRHLMSSGGLDSLLVTRREDVRYLSGFTGSSGSLLVSSARSYLVTDFRYLVQARREAPGIKILLQKKDHFTAIRDAAASMDIGMLWFDESALTVEWLRKLRKQGIRLKGHPDLVKTLRQRKDKQELANMRLAVRRAEESFRELAADIVPGATERGLGLKLDYLIREKGSRRAAFDTIVASGMNGAMPHASVTNRSIKKGDMVTFDFGAEANGYFSDLTRTYCVGRPSTRQREVHDLVLRAQLAAIRSIRTTVPCKSVDDAAREVIKLGGYGRHFGHGTGHGIGLMVHEGPTVSPLSRDALEQDMVFTIEPGIYIPGWGGVRIEDMVQVTSAGARVMTTLPKEIDGLKIIMK